MIKNLSAIKIIKSLALLYIKLSCMAKTDICLALPKQKNYKVAQILKSNPFLS